MKETIKIINKYTGITEETIQGHLNLDYYMTIAKDIVREKAILDLAEECPKMTEEEIQTAITEGYEIQILYPGS